MLSSACALTLALALTSAAGSQPAAPLDRPFQQLLTNLGRDMRALPSTGTGLILGAGAAGALMLHPADDNLAEWAAARGESRYTGFGKFLGDGWVQAGGAVATYAIGAISGHATATHVGSDLIRGQLLNGIATRGLKLAVSRRRPSGGDHSFPSGHSSAAFVSAAVLGAHFGPKVGIPAYAAAGFIGWTRVRDDAHWLSDVIIGGAVGTIVGHAVAGAHRTGGWTVTPTASTTGVGVFVVKN